MTKIKGFFKRLVSSGSKKRVILKRTLLGLGALVLLCGLGLGIFVWVAVAGAPKWDSEVLEKISYTSTVYDKDGNEIARISSLESRLPFKYEDMPELLVQTIVALEDKRFYDHGGVDPMRIVKGAFAGSEQPEGARTLTMQLVSHTVFANEDRSSGGITGITRKIQEAYLATQLERYYMKNEILTAYMAHIFFGHGSYGVRSAAQVYFGKELNELTPPEIALLCGLPQAPTSYDPYINPESAKDRRMSVLRVMRENNLISSEDYDIYKDEPFTYVDKVAAGSDIVDRGLNISTHYPYFVDYVRTALQDQYGLDDEMIVRGLHIYTTVDPKIQQAAEAAMIDPENFPESKDAILPQGALIMLDNATGDVVSMVGGRGYPENTAFAFNRVTHSTRQAGLAAVPVITYAAALDYGGYDANTVIEDAPVIFGGWSPQNYDGIYRGPISMREAVRHVVNIYAVKLYAEAGPEYCWNFAKNMGWEMSNTNYSNYSNALGAFLATPMEMALAYAAFPNKGVLNEPRCITQITDVNRNVILEPPVQNRRVMKETTASTMCDLLRGVVAEGTGTRAGIGSWYICGMTGTTVLDPDISVKGNPDAWFIGFSPIYTAAVWMGYDVTDQDHYLYNEYGGNRPAAIWNQVMTKALEELPEQTSMP
ncbi:MAG: transglycosylase domain-containing protein [Peptococcaceae bacterium]|nr:transglycosylase domain-containing protein [Peptococcaceae bacterium]